MEIMPPPQHIIDQWIQDDANKEARKYLADTDWYVIRQLETGVPVPDEVTTKRAEYRLVVVDNVTEPSA